MFSSFFYSLLKGAGQVNFYILQNEELKTVLNTDELGDNTAVLTANVSEKLDSYDILTLEIPADDENIQYLKEDNTIVYEDLKGWREYIITEVEDVDSDSITRTVTAELSSVELLDEIVIPELKGTSNNPTTILTQTLKNTRWVVGSVDNSIYNSSFGAETAYKTVLEVLDMISSEFSCEVQFSYVVDRGKVVRRQVNLYKKFGEDKGKRFEIDKDVTSIKRIIDTTSLKTAIIPVGKMEGQDELVDITDLVWSKSKGDPVDKPKGQNWIGNPDALAQWGRLNPNGTRRHRFTTVEMEVESIQQLASMAWVQLGGYINPKVTYEAEVKDLFVLNSESEDFAHEKVNLGDTVVVIDNYFKVPIIVQSRIVEVERNLLDPLDKKVVFGESLEQFSIGSVADSVDSIKDKVAKEIAVVQRTADGKNTIYYGSLEPVEPNTGDLWYRPHPTLPNESQMLIFNGTTWDISNDTSKLTELAELFVEIEALAEAAKKAAEDSYTNALAEGKAYTDTKAAEFDSEFEAINQEVSNVKTDADNALIKADQAIEDAGFAKVGSATALTRADSATNTANTAKSNAESALAEAKKALTDIDTLDSTVNNQGILITQNKTAIGLKADKTLVDSIKGTVDKHTTDITATAEGLKLKADSTLVNTIKGTVDQHSASISANAQAINARLTSAQVDSLVTGKGYATTNQLNATSGSLTSKIEAVETDLGNLEIGGRNLILNSDFSEGTSKWQGIDGGVKKDGNISYVTISGTFDINQNIETVKGQDYIISLLVRKASTANSRVSVKFNTDNGDTTHADVTSTEWSRVSLTRRATTSGNQTMYFHTRTDNPVDIAYIMFETGNKASAWNRAPEDQATKVEFSSLEQTVSGINTTVGNHTGQISTINQTVNGINTTVSSHTGQISTLQQTTSGLQTTVANKADKTQITQLSNQISTKVESATYNSKMTQLDNAINLRVVAKDVTAAILADKTIKDTRNDNQVPYWYLENYPKQEVREFKLRTVLGLPGTSTYVQLTTKVPWAGGTSGGVPVQIAESTDGTYQRVSSSSGGSWLAWDKVAEAGKLLSQINLSTEGVLIQGKRIQLDGDVSMTTAFVNNIKAKSLEAVYADISTLKTKVLTTDVITSTMLKSDTALINKIFATDANVNALTAKTAFVNSVKAVNIAADRITSGTLNAANVNIINLNASKIVANSLSALTTETGALNVTDWLTISTENKGIKATYDYGDPYGGAFNARWFVGDFRLGYRYISMDADVYEVTPQNTRGAYRHTTASYIGADYFKFRQYNKSGNLLNRIDIAADYISMADKDFNNTNVMISSNGSGYFSNDVRVAGDLWVSGEKALKAYYVQAPETANNMYLNGGRNELGSMRLGLDGSTLNGGRLVSSDSVYKRTYSSAANVVVFDTGTIGRSVSARKYKLNIKTNDLLETAIKTLEISPSSWFDKGEVESISKNLTNETLEELDANFKLQRHYGFVADEFHEKGATEVVVYDSNGEVEGLAYDRLSMYHHELIRYLYGKIGQLEKIIQEMESKQ